MVMNLNPNELIILHETLDTFIRYMPNGFNLYLTGKQTGDEELNKTLREIKKVIEVELYNHNRRFSLRLLNREHEQ